MNFQSRIRMDMLSKLYTNQERKKPNQSENINEKINDPPQELVDISKEEYEELFPKILIYSKETFISSLKKYIKIVIDQKKIQKYNDSEIEKSVEKISNEYYTKDYTEIKSIIKSIKDIESKKFKSNNYIPHCNKNTIPIHNCGYKFYDLDNYLLCLNCNMIYKYSLVLFNCNNCNTDYFSEVLDRNATNDNKDIYKLVTWDKYHCHTMINESMKCIKCKDSPLYIKIHNNNYDVSYISKAKLICLKCKSEFKQNEINWNCYICHKSFKSEAKIYNAKEYRYVKNIIKTILFNNNESYPSELPCCGLNTDKIKKYKFRHKKDCDGVILEGMMNQNKVVLCSICQNLFYYDHFMWYCPICGKRFRLNEIDKEKEKEKDKVDKDNDKGKKYGNNSEKIENKKININGMSNSETNFSDNSKNNNSINNDNNYVCNNSNSNHNNSTNNSNNNSTNNVVSTDLYNTENNINKNINNINYDNGNSNLDNLNNEKIEKNDNKYLPGYSYYLATRNKKTIADHRKFGNNYSNRDNSNFITQRNDKFHYSKYDDAFERINEIDIRGKKDENINKSKEEIDEEDNKQKIELVKLAGNNYFHKMNTGFFDLNKQKILNRNVINKNDKNLKNSKEEIQVDDNKELFNNVVDKNDKRSKNNPNGKNRSLDAHGNILSKGTYDNNNNNDKSNNKNEYENDNKLDNIIKKDQISIKFDGRKNISNSPSCSNRQFYKTNQRNYSPAINENSEGFNKIIKNKSKFYDDEYEKSPIGNDTHLKQQKFPVVAKRKPASQKDLDKVGESKIIRQLHQFHKQNINNNNNNNHHHNEPPIPPSAQPNLPSSKDSKKEVSSIPKTPSCSLPTFVTEDYKIIRLIGQGTFAQIYCCTRNNKSYALRKIIVSTDKEAKALMDECSLIASLSKYNLNLVKLYAVNMTKADETTTIVYILMELAIRDWEKEIKNRIGRKKYYKEEDLLVILKELAHTFAELQRHNISHRDIKPQNILIFPFNSYKISDFGEAKKILRKSEDCDDPVKQTIRGTELYMSPILFEALNNKNYQVNNYTVHNAFKSDVFSLGFCFILAATLSFQSLNSIREIKNMEEVKNVLDPYLKGRYSDGFIEIIYKMIQIKEEDRVDFIQLDAFLHGK